ncbi:MAG: SulP family inorganic anion transporter [Muribaculaceae bacterium]|nr:SulP family inorganic anion transporter [Muribaculaceae bacterium]
MAVGEKLVGLKGDLFGAIIASIIAFPQAVAFGVASGMGACAGLYGAIILSLVAGILGCNLPFVSGPTGPTAIIAAIVVSSVGGNLASVVPILIMAAIFQIIISLTEIPRMIKYVPYPVISGFLTGIGLIIIILQLPALLGGVIHSSTIKALMYYPEIFSNINSQALILGGITLGILFLTPKIISKFIPVQLLALILMTGISYYFGFDVEKVSGVAFSLPHAYIPHFSVETFTKDVPIALTLAFIATSESLLTGIIMDSLTKVRHNSKRLVASQGIGNLFCALTGSMFGAAATMRSVAAVKAGAVTRICALVSAFILGFVMFKFTGFIVQIPICVLAAILIKIGYDILDLKVIKVLKYAPKDDLYVLVTVLGLTVFYNLIFALGMGIVLAALLYAKRVADNTNIKVNKYMPEAYSEYETLVEQKSHYKIRILHIDGQFFFGSITQIVSHFDRILETEYIILNYGSNSELDMSAIFALEDIIVRLQAQKIKLYLVVPNEKVYNQLKSMEIISQIGQDSLFSDENDAIDKAIVNTHLEKII